MSKSPQPKLSGHRPSEQIPKLPASPLHTSAAGGQEYPGKRIAEVAEQYAPTSADPRPRRVKYATSGK